MGTQIGICPICNKQVYISNSNSFAHLCRIQGEPYIMRTNETFDINLITNKISYAQYLSEEVVKQKEERANKRRERDGRGFTSTPSLPPILIEDDIF